MMDKLVQLRLLLMRQHLGELTPEEAKELAELMLQPGAEEIREEIQSLPKEPILELLAEDVEPALANVYTLERSMRLRRRRVRGWAAVACVLLLAGGATMLVLQNRRPAPNMVKNDGAATIQLESGEVIALKDSGAQAVNAYLVNQNRVISIKNDEGATSEPAWATLTVPAKLDYRLNLPDGSKIWLNSLTQIRFSGREVYLSYGEAFFDVAKNTAPFLVHTARGKVLVLGTAFNINAYSNARVVTSLVSGKVAVEAGIDREILLPGKEAVQTAGEAIKIQPFEEDATIGWRNGIHYFMDASLKEVATMLERWYGIQLTIDNKDIENIQIRGVLNRNEPIQNFIAKMNQLDVVKFYWDDKQNLHCK